MNTSEEMLREIHSVLFPKQKPKSQSDEEFKEWFKNEENKSRFKRLTKNK